MSYPETLVVVKRYKTDSFQPSDVQGDPKWFIERLFRGFVVVNLGIEPLNTRALYGRNGCGWRSGRFTFATAAVLIPPPPPEFSKITVEREVNLFPDDEVVKIHLPEATPGEYSKMEIPATVVPTLLRYVLIFGGETDDQTPLRELFIGESVGEKEKQLAYGVWC